MRIRHEVTEIDTVKKRVKVRNIDKNMDFWETWDDLLIATGASPVVPQSENIDAPGIFSLSTLQSGINVNNFINENKPAKAVIVGGGYIGIEMAEALLARSIEVTIIDMAPQLMTSLDKDMSDQILAYLKEQQVKIFLEETLEKFTKNADGSVNSVITNKQTLPADIVIVGVGIKPNAGLAANAGIKIGKNGAIHINKRCETSALNIWAAGDCAESFHLITHEQVHIALGTVASKHGLTAGINISGGNMEFPGVMGTAITKFKEMEISRTGLSEKEAKNLNIDFETAMITTVSPASYYPDAKEISVKLVINKQSRRILGGQIVGFEGTGKRIDSIVTAITAGFTAQQLMDLDLAYAPPFSNVWDPVQIAARRLL